MMFVTNHQANNGFEKTPVVVKYALKDIDTFLKELNYQITFTVSEGFNTLTDRIKIDLEGEFLVKPPFSFFVMENETVNGMETET